MADVAKESNSAAGGSAAINVSTAAPGANMPANSTANTPVPAPHFRRSVSEDEGGGGDVSLVRATSSRRRAPLQGVESTVPPRSLATRRPAPLVRERAQGEYDISEPTTRSLPNPSTKLVATPLATAGAWLTRCREWFVEVLQAEDP